MIKPLSKNMSELYGLGKKNDTKEIIKSEEQKDENQTNMFEKSLEVLSSFDRIMDFDDSFEKAHPSGLIPKKVTITMKDGSTHQAIRWVNPDSNLPQKIGHAKYGERTNPDEIDNFINETTNSDEAKTVDKVRNLIASGIYDKESLNKLAGMKTAQYHLKEEAKINPDDFKNLGVDDIGRVTKGLPTTKNSDYKSKEVASKLINEETGVMKAIFEIEELDDDLAFEKQKDAAKALLADLGIDEPTVDDKWENYESSLRSFIKRGLGSKSLLAYGTGGIGKTYTFMNVADELGLIEYDKERDLAPEEYDYVTVTGKIGSNELQRYMFNHSQKTLVFDDCDSMWQDPELINVLKGALDTSNPGKVQFKRGLPESSKGAGDDVPASFRFTGKMIFITNLSKKKLNSLGAAPIVESRALSMDLSMSPEQTMERIEKILPKIKIKDGTGESYQGLTEEDKNIAFQVFKGVSLKIGRVSQMNTRVFSHILAKAVEQREDLGGHNINKLYQFAIQFIGGL